MSNISQIQIDAIKDISHSTNLEQLENYRILYLGKKGVLTEQMKLLISMQPEEKKNFGANLNIAKQSIELALESRKILLEEEALEERLQKEKIDITAPIRPEQQGSIHPITKTIEEVIAIFSKFGFEVADGPEIEDDFHNFTALNIPEHHPARQMQDTFYLPGNMLLRTQTSSVQVRTMEKGQPPFKFIAPGRVYRSDYDITHSPMFHQIEGLYIDKQVNFGHLKGCVIQFLEEFFGIDNLPIRFRANFFPFTEPSAEVDIGYIRENGEIKIGKGDKWLEIMGCGLVHPNVLRNVGIDPEQYQGFAFGMGVERIAMLKYAIPDLRTFFEGDIRWMEHYNFTA